MTRWTHRTATIKLEPCHLYRKAWGVSKKTHPIPTCVCVCEESWPSGRRGWWIICWGEDIFIRGAVKKTWREPWQLLKGRPRAPPSPPRSQRETEEEEEERRSSSLAGRSSVMGVYNEQGWDYSRCSTEPYCCCCCRYHRSSRELSSSSRVSGCKPYNEALMGENYCYYYNQHYGACKLVEFLINVNKDVDIVALIHAIAISPPHSIKIAATLWDLLVKIGL